jgi:hypothetical protein
VPLTRLFQEKEKLGLLGVAESKNSTVTLMRIVAVCGVCVSLRVRARARVRSRVRVRVRVYVRACVAHLVQKPLNHTAVSRVRARALFDLRLDSRILARRR